MDVSPGWSLALPSFTTPILHATIDKLIALRRIINLPLDGRQARWPRWGRLLLIALGASFFLHGMVLDLWRGATRLDGQVSGNLRLASLHAKLQTPILEKRPVEPVLQQVERSSDLSSTLVQLPASTAGMADLQDVAAERSSLGSVLPQEVSPERIAIDGLRPLSLAEGLVAYRLALLVELRPPSMGSLTNSLRIMLSWRDGAADLNIMNSSGDVVADQTWLSAMTHAVASTVQPSVLVGQAFSLDLDIEP